MTGGGWAGGIHLNSFLSLGRKARQTRNGQRAKETWKRAKPCAVAETPGNMHMYLLKDMCTNGYALFKY